METRPIQFTNEEKAERKRRELWTENWIRRINEASKEALRERKEEDERRATWEKRR